MGALIGGVLMGGCVVSCMTDVDVFLGEGNSKCCGRSVCDTKEHCQDVY